LIIKIFENKVYWRWTRTKFVRYYRLSERGVVARISQIRLKKFLQITSPNTNIGIVKYFEGNTADDRETAGNARLGKVERLKGTIVSSKS